MQCNTRLLSSFQMETERHQSCLNRKQDDEDDDSEEGELDSSISDDDDEPMNPSASISLAQQTSQSWTTMLNEQNLSSIMSNALADHSQIIHIDDPITQQSQNPLNYGFPQGTNIAQYFDRKQKQSPHSSIPKHRTTRRQLKKLSQLLHREKNEELLQVILHTIGHRRAFDYAQQALVLYEKDDSTLKQCENGRRRSLGEFILKC